MEDAAAGPQIANRLAGKRFEIAAATDPDDGPLVEQVGDADVRRNVGVGRRNEFRKIIGRVGLRGLRQPRLFPAHARGDGQARQRFPGVLPKRVEQHGLQVRRRGAERLRKRGVVLELFHVGAEIQSEGGERSVVVHPVAGVELVHGVFVPPDLAAQPDGVGGQRQSEGVGAAEALFPHIVGRRRIAADRGAGNGRWPAARCRS